MTLYENSLGLALIALFVLSFLLHASHRRRFVQRGASWPSAEPTVSAVGYLFTSRFWFESMQNWQSEFLAVGVLIVFSIFLRQRGSPESKPVAASHFETGTT